VTVEVEQALSVTTVKPLGRVLTDALLALAGSGFKVGRPGYSSVPSKSLLEREENNFACPVVVHLLVASRRAPLVATFIMIVVVI